MRTDPCTGSVHLTPEGEVRWTTFSIFEGEERWRSEGIQIGGIRSARGVWGHWFEKDYLEEGPAGPTAFWKLTDEQPSNNYDTADLGDHGFDVRHQMLTLQNLFRPAWMHEFTVDSDPGAERLHGRAVSQYSRGAARRSASHDDDDNNDESGDTAGNGRHTSDSDSDESDDVPSRIVAPVEIEPGTEEPTADELAALEAVPHLLDVEWEEDDSDEEADGDFIPMTNAMTGELIEVDDVSEEDDEEGDDTPREDDAASDHSDDIPPADQDDIVIEEALVEEEEVPFGHGETMPDGEDVLLPRGDSITENELPSSARSSDRA